MPSLSAAPTAPRAPSAAMRFIEKHRELIVLFFVLPVSLVLRVLRIIHRWWNQPVAALHDVRVERVMQQIQEQVALKRAESTRAHAHACRQNAVFCVKVTCNDQIHCFIARWDPICLKHNLGLSVRCMPWIEGMIQQFIQLQAAAKRARSDSGNRVQSDATRAVYKQFGHERREVVE